MSGSTAPNIKGASNRRGADLNQGKPRKVFLIIAGTGTLALVATVAFFLRSTIDKKAGAKAPQPEVSAASVMATPAQPSTATQSPSEEVNTTTPQSVPEPPKDTGSSPVESLEIRSLSEQLCGQISQKSGYAFAPEFVELIRARTQEYVNQKAVGGARLYRREINKSFRDEAVNPLIGYVLAMSRSKFNPRLAERGIGIWQIPPSVARSLGYLGPGENIAKLSNPESSAQITARYTKDLLSTFDAEDFMYAIACFGMNLQDVGRVQARLVKVAPDAKSRRDIMKIIGAGGVLNADQVDGVARFFAAGIVGENPQKFGLEDSQPFSSLW
ncbi:MAG TPA: transglycosylase SLT domain-containing protein [Nitrososphaera sp.]|nr:transglycosylase SLT domain-containing protein [Nitrososphaera sp.]